MRIAAWRRVTASSQRCRTIPMLSAVAVAVPEEEGEGEGVNETRYMRM